MAVSQSEIDRAVQKCANAGYDAKTCGRNVMARVCSIPEKRARRIQSALRGGVQIQIVPTSGGQETHTHRGDEWTVVIPKTSTIHTLEELLAHCKADLSEWEVKEWECKKWDMSYVPRSTRESQDEKWVRPDSAAQTVENWSVRAVFKRKIKVIAAKGEIASLIELAKAEMPPAPAIIKHVRGSGLMLEVAMPDLHVGKEAWAKETGWQNYDTKTAIEVGDAAFEALMSRTASYDFDRVLYVVGNDLLHVDNKQGTTTSGTPLAAEGLDGRFQKNFVAARELTCRHLLRVRSVAPVTALVVPGNHDGNSAWCLGHSLECFFHTYNDVDVDNSPLIRKYFRWGSTMLMFTHGNKGKLTDYPLLMAVEQPRMWGDTTHHEAHTADKHQEKVWEIHGVKVRICPALCPPDYWHAENCFVGAERSAQAFVWDRDEGLIGTATYTVPPPERFSS